jgi:hypothetical protein
MGQNGGEQEILSRARGREGRERVFVLEMIAQRREFNGASVLLPVGGEAMMVQLSQCDSGGGGGGVRFVRGRVDLDFVWELEIRERDHIDTYMRRNTLIHHEKEALLGSRQLRNVVAWMSAPDMLLHRAKAFFSQTSLATIGAVVVLQRTDDLVRGICDRKGGEGAPGRHVDKIQIPKIYRSGQRYGQYIDRIEYGE